MPTIQPVNTQQVLQMGTAVEKIQQTAQQLPATTAQQLSDEQFSLAEMKREEVQDSEEANPSEESNPEGKNRQGRLRRKMERKQKPDSDAALSGSALLAETDQGKQIDLLA